MGEAFWFYQRSSAFISGSVFFVSHPAMRVSELDYELPPERIAAAPAEPRDSARLLVVHRDDNRLEHHRVHDLPELGLLQPGDLLVVNQTRVLPAFLTATRSKTGGKVTGLYLETSGTSGGGTSGGGDFRGWRVMLESRGRLREGERLELRNGQSLTLVRDLGQGQWEVQTDADLHDVGSTPLPPYIRKVRRKLGLTVDEPSDAERYNTVYAAEEGSVAAPTAGLHFTPRLLQALDDLGVRRAAVTLHVGMGTFMPIRSEQLEEHTMHREHVHVPIETLRLLQETLAAGRRIVPVGTTTIRALESLPAQWQALSTDFVTDTDLFIYPRKFSRPRNPRKFPGKFQGFRFADAVMTNFHLPRSTLLAMIAALPGVGLERLLGWYKIAIDEGYRFYSYGDAMWLAPRKFPRK